MHNEKCSVCWGDNPNWIQHHASSPCSCPEFDGGGLETYVDNPEDSEEIDPWDLVLDDDSYEDDSEEDSEQNPWMGFWFGSAAAEPIALLAPRISCPARTKDARDSISRSLVMDNEHESANEWCLYP